MMSTKNTVFKSVLDQLTTPLQTAVQHVLPDARASFTIRPLNVEHDLPIIYQWVNQPYAIPYWQLNGDYQLLLETYAPMEDMPYAQSLVACLNGELISQLDMYDPFADPIHAHYDAAEGDMGIHLLMAPGKKLVKDFTVKVLYLFLSRLFQSPLVKRVVGEPDENNQPANLLLHKLSFQFIRRLELPHKNANFYIMTRQQFLSLPAASFLF